jgi:hypothetical protein
MNDRMATLLGFFGLEERLLDKFDGRKIKKLISKPINWKTIRQRIEPLREIADVYFKNALGS